MVKIFLILFLVGASASYAETEIYSNGNNEIIVVDSGVTTTIQDGQGFIDVIPGSVVIISRGNDNMCIKAKDIN